MIMRADSCVMVSSTCPAKNKIAVSRIANSSAKNTGATRANSTTVAPRRLRRNRRNALRSEAREAADEDIEEPQGRQRLLASISYLKLIVEVFRPIEAAWPGLLTLP